MLTSVVFISFLPFANLLYGLVGGLLGSLIGYAGKKETIRWSVSFALIGILCTYIFLRYSATNQLFISRDVYTFAPLFAIIGTAGTIIFKYHVEDSDWRWLILFPFVGVVAAVLYQSLAIAIPLAILGSASGILFWYFATSKLRWIILCASAGFILVWTLMTFGYSLNFNISFSILVGVIGGSVSYLIHDQAFKWIISIAVLGALVGGVVEFMYIVWGVVPIILGTVLGGIVGLVVKSQRHREVLVFTLLGGVFFSLIQLGWDAIKLFERLDRML